MKDKHINNLETAKNEIKYTTKQKRYSKILDRTIQGKIPSKSSFSQTREKVGQKDTFVTFSFMRNAIIRRTICNDDTNSKVQEIVMKDGAGDKSKEEQL